MIPSRIASNLAQLRLVRLLTTRFKLPDGVAEELMHAIRDVALTVVQELRAELEAERDESRRRFYEINPTLHPERGHMPPASSAPAITTPQLRG